MAHFKGIKEAGEVSREGHVYVLYLECDVEGVVYNNRLGSLDPLG